MDEKTMRNREKRWNHIYYAAGVLAGVGCAFFAYKAGHKAGLSDMYAAITLTSPEVATKCSELAKNCVKS